MREVIGLVRFKEGDVGLNLDDVRMAEFAEVLDFPNS